MKSYMLCVLILILSINLSAQKSSIRGRVMDASGEGLAGANVVVDQSLLGVITKADGEFEIRLDAGQKYVLLISYVGYKSQELELSPPFRDFYEINLETSVFMGEEAVVTSTRADDRTPIAHENMDAEEIRKQDMGQDVAYLLSLTPSLVASSESGTGIGYTNFRIRGSDPSRINITLDGIPLNDAESQQVFWVNMPAFSSSLNSIQVQRGVGTSTNGAAAFGATVNMQTRAPSMQAYGELNSTFGSFHTFINTIRAGTGLIRERLALDFRYSRLKSDGYVDYSFSDNQSMQFTANYFTKKGRIKANIILGEQRTGISWWGIDETMLETNRRYNPAGQYTTPEGEARYYENQTDNYWQNHYHLLYSTQLSSNLLLNTALFYVDGEGYYEQYREDESLSDYYLVSAVSESDLIRQKWLENDFFGTVFSLVFSRNRLKLSSGGGLNHYLGDHFGRLIWMRYAGATEKGHEWYRNHAGKTDANLYQKANYQLGQRWNLFGDMQYRYVFYRMEGIDDDGYLRELAQDHHFHFFNPKLGARFALNNHQYAYASFSIGNREPTRQNFKDATGDPDATPRPERLRDLEIGYSYREQKMTAGMNLYYMDYIDQLVPTGELSTDGYPIMTNVKRSYRSGMEFSLGFIPASFLQWQVNLTWSRNKIKDFVESYVDYDSQTWIGTPEYRELGDVDIAYSPSMISSSDLAFLPLKELEIHLISQYVGEQYFVNTMNDDMKLDPWLVNNLRIDYTLSLKKAGQLGLHLQVNNLFNILYENNAYGATWWQDGQEYYWAAYFPQATRNFLFKMSWRF